MIDLVFEYLQEIVLVRIIGNDIRFSSSNFGAVYSGIEGLKLDYDGVCKEFPDLKTKENWREEAIKRFKEKIRGLKTEEKKAEYIIDDLKKHNYTLIKEHRAGFRPKVMNPRTIKTKKDGGK